MAGNGTNGLPEDRLDAVVEAVIFSSGEPVQPGEIADALEGVSVDEVHASLARLERRYAESGSGLRVERVAGGLQLATDRDVGPWVRRFFRRRNRARISPAALETLAIIAYRQPITAPEIQAIRGRDPSAPLKTMLEKKLIRVLGKKKVVGRPMLYGTSRQFLVHFGLDSLDDLPAFEDFEELAGSLEAAAGLTDAAPDDEAGDLREEPDDASATPEGEAATVPTGDTSAP